MAKQTAIWVVSYNDEIAVAFKKKPTQQVLKKYFDIRPEDFAYGSPLDDMHVEKVTLIG